MCSNNTRQCFFELYLDRGLSENFDPDLFSTFDTFLLSYCTNKTSNDLIRLFVEDVITRRRIFLSPSRRGCLEQEFISRNFHVIYQTREDVFHQISKHWEVGWKNEVQPSFFKRLRGVWISDETHFRVFDIASQMINNFWRNSRLKLANFYSN